VNERIRELAEQTGYIWHASGDPQIYEFTPEKLEKFAELIIEECAACCGSQADKKNIRQRFELPVESNVKYPAPERDGSVNSQYEREYNLPNGATKEIKNILE
jgi:L-2-hydroxyglutarate oxidase LhgO